MIIYSDNAAVSSNECGVCGRYNSTEVIQLNTHKRNVFYKDIFYHEYNLEILNSIRNIFSEKIKRQKGVKCERLVSLFDNTKYNSNIYQPMDILNEMYKIIGGLGCSYNKNSVCCVCGRVENVCVNSSEPFMKSQVKYFVCCEEKQKANIYVDFHPKYVVCVSWKGNKNKKIYGNIYVMIGCIRARLTNTLYQIYAC